MKIKLPVGINENPTNEQERLIVGTACINRIEGRREGLCAGIVITTIATAFAAGFALWRLKKDEEKEEKE